MVKGIVAGMGRLRWKGWALLNWRVIHDSLPLGILPATFTPSLSVQKRRAHAARGPHLAQRLRLLLVAEHNVHQPLLRGE